MEMFSSTPGLLPFIDFKVEMELLQRKGLVLAAAFGTTLLHNYAQLSPCSFFRDTLEILIPDTGYKKKPHLPREFEQYWVNIQISSPSPRPILSAQPCIFLCSSLTDFHLSSSRGFMKLMYGLCSQIIFFPKGEISLYY